MPISPFVIGIAGGSGSGKSWFAKKLGDAFPDDATIIEQDWYYRDLSGMPSEIANAVNFDHPDAIEFPLLLKHLETLIRGETVQAPGYRYSTHQRIENAHPLLPAPLLIVEGLFTLHHQDLIELFDHKLFIETSELVRFERRLHRDVLHRGYSKEQITQSWQERTVPMFERFVAPSAIHADNVWNPLRDSAFENSFLADLRNRLANNEKRKP